MMQKQHHSACHSAAACHKEAFAESQQETAWHTNSKMGIMYETK
ncbi:hypothetical protein [Domibacillus mangrovi]|nr:hypothetical protein [Domibacillus mangrovi]